VLHHLDDDDLRQSLERQSHALNPGGYLLHAFWHGNEVEHHHGMSFHNRRPKDVIAMLPENLTSVDHAIYEEMTPEDSLWLLVQSTR